MKQMLTLQNDSIDSMASERSYNSRNGYRKKKQYIKIERKPFSVSLHSPVASQLGANSLLDGKLE